MKKGIHEDFNLEYLKKVKKAPKRRLKDLLELHTKDELESIYSTLSNREPSGNKKILIKKVEKLLNDMGVLERNLNLLVEYEYDLIKELIENNGVITNNDIDTIKYGFLEYSGLIYFYNLDGKIYTVMPDEIINEMEDIEIKNKVIKNTRLYDFSVAVVNLYGAIPVSVYVQYAMDYLNYDNPREINFDCVLVDERRECLALVNGFNNENEMYLRKPNYLDDEEDAIDTFDVVTKDEDILFDVPYKKLPLKELLNYKDFFYYERTDDVIKLENLLKNNSKKMTEKDIDLSVGVIVNQFRVNYDNGMKTLNEMLEEANLNITSKNYNEVMKIITNIIMNVPLWGSKGYTYKEIILGKFDKKD